MTSLAPTVREQPRTVHHRWPLALLLSLLGCYLLLALVSYRPAQITGVGEVPQNLGGPVGARVGYALVEAWGLAAWFLPLVLIGYAVALLRAKTLARLSLRITGAVLLLPALAGLIHLLPEGGWREQLQMRWDQVRYHGVGGRVGWLLCVPPGTVESATATASGDLLPHPGGLLRRHLGAPLSALVLGAVAVGCLVLMRLHLLARSSRVVRALRDNLQQPARTGAPVAPRGHGRLASPPAPSVRPPAATSASHAPAPAANTLRSQAPDPASAPAAEGRSHSAIDEVARRLHQRDSTTSLDAKDLVERIRARRRELEESDIDDAEIEDDEADADAAAAPTWTPPTRRSLADAREATPAPVAGAASDDEDGDDEDSVVEVTAAASAAARERRAQAEAIKAKRQSRKPRRAAVADHYELPPVELLEETPERRDSEHDAEMRDTIEAIQGLFREFNINVKVVTANRGPVITQYELEMLDAGMRVNKVQGFEKDLSLRLGTEGIRIVAPLPNRKTIGIEVPNALKEPVVMRDLVETIDPEEYILPLVLGRDVLGSPMVGDLARMPHLLIAGATGMGKSVCLNAIISSVLLFRDPETVKFIMVDPKIVELAPFEGIPHLLTPPITDMSKAHAALEWACKTMDERFFALRMVGVRDIISYNKLGDAEIRKRLAKKDKTPEDVGIETTMPWIVLVVDEFADLMMVNKEVEKSIIRLCAKSRACGIHVILATQRPSADVVTGLIKANLPSRLCFRVADRNNSRVVLDASGAENLLGRGDMLFLPPGSSNLIRGQGVWVKDHELEGIIEHAQEQGEPEYDDSIFTTGAAALAGTSAAGSVSGVEEWLADRQFHEAVWSMYHHDRTGADFLRRKLGVGYNKATKYVEWLEDLGFLSQTKGSKPREFLKSWDDWLDELKAQGLSWDEEDEIYWNPF